MTVSPDEAMGMLKKWDKERALLSALVWSQGMIGSAGGFITELTPELLVIKSPAPNGAQVAEIKIALDLIVKFNYADARELPKDRGSFASIMTSVLIMETPEGNQCYIYELMP